MIRRALKEAAKRALEAAGLTVIVTRGAEPAAEPQPDSEPSSSKGALVIPIPIPVPMDGAGIDGAAMPDGVTLPMDGWLYVDTGEEVWELPLQAGAGVMLSFSRVGDGPDGAIRRCDRRQP